jgi:hypothetical protein
MITKVQACVTIGFTLAVLYYLDEEGVMYALGSS